MNDIKDIQHDDILRQAVMRNQQKLPKIPADLNEKLLARLTAEPAAATEPEAAKTADRKPRRAVMMRWISAAACALVLIGIGITVINTDDKAAKIEARAEIAPQPAIETTAESPSETADDQAASASNDQPKIAESAAKVRTTRTARKAHRQVEQIATPEPETAKRKIEVKVISRPMDYEELLMASAQAQPEAIRARGQRLYNDVARTMNLN